MELIKKFKALFKLADGGTEWKYIGINHFYGGGDDEQVSPWLQYSGWKDKNGVEIYESDIISLVNEVGNTITVICQLGLATRLINGRACDIIGFYFLNEELKKTFPIASNYLGKHDCEIFENIGNHYANPELLTPKTTA